MPVCEPLAVPDAFTPTILSTLDFELDTVAAPGLLIVLGWTITGVAKDGPVVDDGRVDSDAVLAGKSDSISVVVVAGCNSKVGSTDDA